jgi:hypothetical protein
VHQPWRVALDLDQSDDEITATTEQLIAGDGVRVDLDDWERDTADRLRAARAEDGHSS